MKPWFDCHLRPWTIFTHSGVASSSCHLTQICKQFCLYIISTVPCSILCTNCFAGTISENACWIFLQSMMTLSNGNICRVTGLLCGEFTGPRWIPHTNGQWRGALMFSLICVWMNDWVNTREAGDLRRHRAHYDVIIMSAKDTTQTPIICFRECDRFQRFIPQYLTHWGRDKMAASFRTTFWNAFSSMKMYELRWRFHFYMLYKFKKFLVYVSFVSRLNTLTHHNISPTFGRFQWGLRGYIQNVGVLDNSLCICNETQHRTQECIMV